MTFSRIDRVQNLIKAEIGTIIDRELDNPKLPPFITIYGVKLSKDLHYATVLVTFLDDTSPAVIRETIEELNKSAGYIGRMLADRVELRRHPKLNFAYNPSTKYALEIEKVFQQIQAEPKVEMPEESEAEGDDAK